MCFAAVSRTAAVFSQWLGVAVAWLLDAQQLGGSWRLAADSDDLIPTALAIQALQPYRQTAAVASALSKARSWLLSERNSMLTWGTSVRNAHALAAVLPGLDIPATQAMNWVGGAQTVDAAQQILGQGGVGNVALVSGGQTKTLRIEHTWVEALNQSNAATALPKLPVGGEVGQEIRSALQAGKEVTVHERQINVHGFTGYGYIITDPDTGAGAYLIEGKGNGGWFSLVFNAATALIVVIGIAGFFALAGIIAPIAFLSYFTLAIAMLALAAVYLAGDDFDSFNCGGAANCNVPNVIQIIVAAVGMVVLLSSSCIGSVGRVCLF